MLGVERPLRFVHPLLRAAVEVDLPPARRAGRAAGALRDELMAGYLLSPPMMSPDDDEEQDELRRVAVRRVGRTASPTGLDSSRQPYRHPVPSQASAPSPLPPPIPDFCFTAKCELTSVNPREPLGVAIRTPVQASCLGPGVDLDEKVVYQHVRARAMRASRCSQGI
ncbi:MAG: hypothetical protein ACLP01_13940 [Solirubrobacteraceae bacterium]